MIDNSELYNEIPKQVEEWNSQDVKKWFQLNKINVSKNLKIDGNQFKKLTPTKLVKQCQIQSHFLIRKITDWIQFQIQDFNEFVQQTKENSVKQQVKEERLIKKQQHQACKIKDPQQFDEKLKQQCSDSQYQQVQLKRQWKMVSNKKSNNGKQENTLQIEQERKQNLRKKLKQIQSSESEIRIQNKQQSQQKSSTPSKIEQNQFKNNLKQFKYYQNDVSPIKNQDGISDIYKPMKYKASKNLKKKKQEIQCKKIEPVKILNQKPFQSEKCFFKNNKNQKNKKQNKIFLQLKNLQQNFQSNEDIPTQKYIPDAQSQQQQSEWQPYFRQYKSQLIKKSQKNQNNKAIQDNFPLSQNPNIKFISSQYCVPQTTTLVFHFDHTIHKIYNSGVTKIGRSNVNDIVLASEGISRLHAQIVAQQEQQCEQKTTRYYLKDVGSKFGTFMQIDPQKPKKINEGDIYCIGSTMIQIVNIKLNKNKQKFDLTLNQIRQQFSKLLVFYNKNQVTAGKKCRSSTSKDSQKNINSQQTKRLKQRFERDAKDFEIDDADVCLFHFRFVILDSSVHLQQVQGNILQKLQKNQLYPINRYQIALKLGDENGLLQKESTYKMLSA